MQPPRILIAGSGAVGAVFAHHLQRAGCEVRFLVRDPDSPNARMPRTLHRFRITRGSASHTQNVPCVTEATGIWDQVWLCVPSTALDDSWMADRLAELNPGTPVLSWTPDIRDRARLEEHCRGPVLLGLIGFLSFQSPLPDTDMKEEGTGYFLPPGLSAVVEKTGEGRRAVAWLRNGGLHSRTDADLAWRAASGAAMLVPAIAALELSGWSFAEMRSAPERKLARDAAREALVAVSTHMDRRSGLAARMPTAVYGPGLSLLMRLGPVLSPVPLEPYLAFHFRKVGDQTRLMLESWQALGAAHNLPTPALGTLRTRLG
jgi:ketopantoate reductase